jgi:hypothetical protein
MRLTTAVTVLALSAVQATTASPILIPPLWQLPPPPISSDQAPDPALPLGPNNLDLPTALDPILDPAEIFPAAPPPPPPPPPAAFDLVIPFDSSDPILDPTEISPNSPKPQKRRLEEVLGAVVDENINGAGK